MGYNKIIRYGNTTEIYRYEESPRGFSRRSRELACSTRNANMALLRENPQRQKELYQKRKDSVRKSKLAFRRLVCANLGESSNPLFISFTYAENITEVRQGHQDFKAFIKRARIKWKSDFTYISCIEFQKRGAIHFHALFWGLPSELARTERVTRLVASLWERGFVDIIETDGSEKLAGYMAKYMAKAFVDFRLFGKKAYFTSRNIKRPQIEKRAMIIPVLTELSTVEPIVNKKFMTQWLGECHYQVYEANKNTL